MHLHQKNSPGFANHLRIANAPVKKWLMIILSVFLFLSCTLLFLESTNFIRLPSFLTLSIHKNAEEAAAENNIASETDMTSVHQDLKDEQARKNEEEEKNKRIVRTIVLYLAMTVALFVIRYLYEGLFGDFFTNTVGILAAVVLSGELVYAILKYFISAFPYIAQRLLFAGSLLSFGILLYFYAGFYPMSTRLLVKSMRRRLLYRELAESDWVNKGNYYPVDVVKMEMIPQNTENINGSETDDLIKCINHFLSKVSAKNHNGHLILVGGFGSGKSTALVQTAQRKLSNSVRHTKNIPVYVKLREWLADNDDLMEIKQKGKYALDQKDKHMKRLFKLITAENGNGKDAEIMYDVLLKLHESRRLVYIFDGLNEVIQRKGTNDGDHDEKNEQFAKNVAAFLNRFSSKNPYIISMCELPNVITRRSICIESPDQYEIYAVKGVRIDNGIRKNKEIKRISANPWMRKLVPNVALYRLAAASMDTAKEQSSGQKGKTIFQLLSEYVNQQIESELISLDEQKYCFEAINRAIDYTIGLQKGAIQQEKISDFLHSAYSGLVPEPKDVEAFRHMCNARLFYEEQVESGQNIFHPSHILIFEYFLAEYFKQKSDFEVYFCGSDKRPDILELPHLRAVFSMLITDVIFRGKGKELEWCKERICEILGWFKQMKETRGDDESTRYLLEFLLLLSRINDDLIDLESEKNFSNLLQEEGIIENTIKEFLDNKIQTDQNKEFDISLFSRFALTKLLPDNQDRIAQLKEEFKTISWVQLPLQRQILYYIGRTPDPGTTSTQKEGGQ